MALFGKIEALNHQIDGEKFTKAFDYLEQVMHSGSVENERLLSMSIDDVNKKYLDQYTFVLEQAYMSRNRSECFYESHRNYIDIQLLLEGEELVEVASTDEMDIKLPYDKETDVVKYNDSCNYSVIRLKHGFVAIFYPQDAHMPCLKIENRKKIVKTVVKVPI